MAVIDYPSTLPSPLISNISYMESQRLLVTDLEEGYSATRKRNTNVPVVFNISLLLSQDQLDIFESWFFSDIESGLKWFNMDLPVGKSMSETHECRLKTVPKVSLQGNIWNVAVEIEAFKLKRNMYTLPVLLFFIEMGSYTEALDFISSLDDIMNNDIPQIGGIILD